MPENKLPDQLEVALLGNPNAGKTTLFNRLTGARQHTGNWPGVTVERKAGNFNLQDKTIHVVDLPGTYSLESGNSSEDEQIARQFVHENPDCLYINVLDASTLQRGLYLTAQLCELGVPVLVVLNMMDVATKRGMQFDLEQLSDTLGCPVLPVSLRKNADMHTLHEAILDYDFSRVSALDIPYTEAIEAGLKAIQAAEEVEKGIAVYYLQHPDKSPSDYDYLDGYRKTIEAATNEEIDFLIADARFEYSNQLAQTVITEQGKVSRTFSDKLDKWVLGRWTGLPIFLLSMYLLFLFSINIGGAFIDFFDLSVQTLLVDGGHYWLSSIGSPDWLTTILADGIGGGVQVVATFIPIIAALFLFLTLLEESGYMSRAAFVMNRFMQKMGLSGKAFVPLIIGFGCNVPGIMATRTLESRRERVMTVLMMPFMSCGARLAVFALFAAAFFPVGGQNIVFLLYLIGIAFAIFTAFIMKKTLLRGDADSFFMELPTYQIPLLKNVLLNTWSKLKGFVLGAGKIIVIVVALINIANSLGTDGSFGNNDSEDSVLSATAQVITPMFSPLGIEDDNWPATVGIITGLLAKEVVVGTLDALYSNISSEDAIDDPTEYNLMGGLREAVSTIPENLSDALQSFSDPLGLGSVQDVGSLEQSAEEQDVNSGTFGAMVNRFNGQIGAFAYLLFILLYFPCVAATGAMLKETGRNWTILGVLWSTGLAYGAAVIFYQLATIADHPLSSILWVAGLLGIFSLFIFLFSLAADAKESVEQRYGTKIGL
jgi:ferrous iron transport protein B